MPDEIHVQTPEEVSLAFYPAGLGSRFIAFLIDALIQTAVLVVLVLLYFGIGLRSLFQGSGEGYFIIAFLVGFLAMGQFLYFILFELFREGKTPGKKIMRIKVVRDGAFPLTLAACLIRNLFRVIDSIPLFWLPVLLNRSHKRLGDYAAGTIVITLKGKKQAGPFQGEAYSRLAVKNFAFDSADFQKMTKKDFETLETFFRRLAEMTPEVAGDLQSKLFSAFVARLGKVALPSQTVVFLKELYLFLREEWGKRMIL